MSRQIFAGYLASPVNMDKPGPYLHLGVIQISVANLIVILLMLLALVLAVLLPFHGRRQR